MKVNVINSTTFVWFGFCFKDQVCVRCVKALRKRAARASLHRAGSEGQGRPGSRRTTELHTVFLLCAATGAGLALSRNAATRAQGQAGR